MEAKKKRPVRKAIFWVHLFVGASVGMVLAVMAVTGATMAFREQITRRAERAVRVVAVPVPATQLEMKVLLDAAREARPEGRAGQVTLSRDPAEAVVVAMGRGDILFANPYTGEIRPSNHPGLRAFFEAAEGLHRWLGLSGKGKQAGLAVTSACCAAYLFLLISGLFLWWPKKRDVAAFLAVMRPRFDRTGKARDRNWHETAGFWASPLLLLTTVTGLIMAYPRLADQLYPRKVPVQVASVQAENANSTTAARPLPIDALLARIERAYPQWDLITLRLGRRRGGDGAAPPGAQPLMTCLVRNKDAWPVWALQLSIDPVTGEITVVEDPAHEPFARALRMSAKAVHTGEAGGAFGQALAAVSALITLVLIATGFSLLVRRIARNAAAVQAGSSNPVRQP